MSMSAEQLIALSVQIAKAPGYLSQCGQLLNAILEELSFTYNLDTAKALFSGTFNTSLSTTIGGQQIYASGPYILPANYLRAVKDDALWFLQGVPYNLIPIDLAEFDNQVQQAGNSSFPYFWCTDMSASPPVAYVFPPPSGNYPFNIRYFSLEADIATPESSATVPWFPMQTYLLRRLPGDLMALTGDDRMESFLGESPMGAQGILGRYLRMADDKQNRAQRISLDRRRFGNRFSRLPNTKLVGW